VAVRKVPSPETEKESRLAENASKSNASFLLSYRLTLRSGCGLNQSTAESRQNFPRDSDTFRSSIRDRDPVRFRDEPASS